MKKITCLLLFTFWGTLLYSQNIVVDGVTFSANGKTLIKYPKDKVGKEYIVPEGTEVIGKEAFLNAIYLKTLTLPPCLKEIEDYALGAPNLISIVWYTYPDVVGQYIFGFPYSNITTFKLIENNNCILIDGVLYSKDGKILLCFPPKKIDDRLSGIYEVPEGTKIIAKNAFSCASIAEVVLPSTLTQIEDCAFHVSWLIPTAAYSDIRTLFKVYCHAIIPPTVIGNAFLDKRAICLHVPEESFDAYRNSIFWQDFYSINGDTGIEQNQVGDSATRVYVEKKQLCLESEKVIEKIEIYNTNGTCIWSESVGNEIWQLDTFRLPINLLLIKVITTDGKQETFKLLNRNTV